MHKSELTRQKILHSGFIYAAQFGLLSVTIGEIAKVAAMSRTGVISHFANKEDMQIAIMSYAQEQFVQRVLKPAYTESALENLQELKYYWLDWTEELSQGAPLGCPFIKASVEYQERADSKIRVFMQNQQQQLLKYLASTVERCIAQGSFSENVDAKQVAYEYYSLYLGHCIQKSLGNPNLTDDHFYSTIDSLIEGYSLTNVTK